MPASTSSDDQQVHIPTLVRCVFLRIDCILLALRLVFTRNDTSAVAHRRARYWKRKVHHLAVPRLESSVTESINVMHEQHAHLSVSNSSVQCVLKLASI